MARYTGPKCKLCRREGTKLFLKGAKCLSDSCPITRRNQPPGPRSIRSRRGGFSDYGRHLREKQKVKRIYGLLEAQFRKYYEEAAKKPGVTGQILLQMLETRLDSVLYSAGFAESRAAARQKVRQGKVQVDEKPVNIPSFRVQKDSVVSALSMTASPKPEDEMPAWMYWDKDKNGVVIGQLPSRDDVSQEINEQLIVEYYSR